MVGALGVAVPLRCTDPAGWSTRVRLPIDGLASSGDAAWTVLAKERFPAWFDIQIQLLPNDV
jgi:hypothetical protein